MGRRSDSIKERFLFIMPLILQSGIWIFTRIVFKIFLRFKIDGLDNIRGLKEPVIFAVNHSSELDPILVPAALPFFSPLMPMFYTSRERSFYGNRGFFSFMYSEKFFRIWGAYKVSVGVKNYERALRNHIRILERKYGSICFFPEGKITKNTDGGLMPAKGGVSFLAHRTKTPIIPVAVGGALNMSAKDFFLRRRSITVSFGKLIDIEGLFEDRYYKPEEYKKIAQIIMLKIKETFNKNR